MKRRRKSFFFWDKRGTFETFDYRLISVKKFAEWVHGFWLYRIVAIGWMGFLFWLSSRHTMPAQNLFYGQDKVEHALAYSVLGLLFALSFKQRRNGLSGRQVLTVTLLALAYGLFDETHQYFVPGRNASLGDLVADGMGGLFAALFAWKCLPRLRNR